MHYESLFRLQVPVNCGGYEKGLEEHLEGLDVGIHVVDTCHCVDTVGRVFGPPLDPLEERLYLLVQVLSGSPCELKVPGTRGRL